MPGGLCDRKRYSFDHGLLVFSFSLISFLLPLSLSHQHILLLLLLLLLLRRTTACGDMTLATSYNFGIAFGMRRFEVPPAGACGWQRPQEGKPLPAARLP